MLSLTRDYKLLLRYGNNSLSHTHEEHLPPVPLACPFNILGRLGSLQGFTEHAELITAIKAISVKSALKKATQAAAPGGAPRVPKTPAQLAAIEQAAANPPWLVEVAEYMAKHPDQPCRYTTIEDLLHPNSVSRFHFLIKREPIAGPAHFRYSIKDLGSLNGLYVDDVKVTHRNWAVLQEGTRLRFAPSTRLAKKYISSFQEAEAAAGRRPNLPPTPLTIKDMYIEYQFNHQMNECSEVIYQNVVLDCGHSFCKSCILTWFKKQKICPVCRAKHKGPPRAVRSVDNVISVLLKQCSTVEEQRERQVRIARIDAESKERAIQELERSRLKAQRDADRARMGIAPGAPPDRVAAALSARRAVDAVMRGNLPDSDDDEDYVPDDIEQFDDDDEFPYMLDRDEDDAEWHAEEMARIERMERMERMAQLDRLSRMPAAAAAAAAAAAPAPAPAPVAPAVLPGPRYVVDSAPNSRAKCPTCNQHIAAHTLRLRPQPGSRWHHMLCVAQTLPVRYLRGRVDGLDALEEPAKGLAESIIG